MQIHHIYSNPICVRVYKEVFINSYSLFNIYIIIIIIIMAGMAVFYVAGYLIEERYTRPVITASPRGQCSK